MSLFEADEVEGFYKGRPDPSLGVWGGGALQHKAGDLRDGTPQEAPLEQFKVPNQSAPRHIQLEFFQLGSR